MTDTPPKPTCNFMSEAELDQLLGTARPKTLKDIEGSDYWEPIFQKWIAVHPDQGVRDAHAAYSQDPKGDAREQLKNSGPNGDLRDDFYQDVGTVKAQMRDWEQKSGTRAKQLDSTIDQLGLS